MPDVRCSKYDARWCGNPKALTPRCGSEIAGTCHRPPRISRKPLPRMMCKSQKWNAGNIACLTWVQQEKVHAIFPSASKGKFFGSDANPKLVFICLRKKEQNQAKENSWKWELSSINLILLPWCQRMKCSTLLATDDLSMLWHSHFAEARNIRNLECGP